MAPLVACFLVVHITVIGCGADDDGAGGPRADGAASDDGDPGDAGGPPACGDKLAYESSLFVDGLVEAATLHDGLLYFATQKDLHEVRVHRVDIEDGSGEVLSILYAEELLGLRFHLVLGGDDLYFGNDEGLWRVGKSGGEPVRITDDDINDVAADETHVYWTVSSGSLKRFSVEEEATEEVFATVEEAAAFARVALDSTHVYWNDRYDLWRRPKAGGDSQPLGQVPTVDETSPLDDLVVADDHLYWLSRRADGDYAKLSRMRTTGGESEELAFRDESTGVSLQPLLVAGNHLYWAEISAGIQRVPITGGEAATVTPWADAFTQSGDSALYLVDGVDGIHAVPLAGCSE